MSLFNNSRFCNRATNMLVNNPYYEDADFQDSIPPTFDFMITEDTGDFMITEDTGDFMITES